MNWAQTIVSGIFTLLGGLVTLLGVILTLRAQNKNQKKAAQDEIQKQRPKLTIEEFVGLHPYDKNEPCDVCAVITVPEYDSNKSATYNENEITREKWASVIYKFKNTGETQIETIRFATDNILHTRIFHAREFEKQVKLFKESRRYINYDKMLNPQETFNLKICYSSNLPENYSYFGYRYTVSIWLTDLNNSWWVQQLNAPKKELSDSKSTNYQEFRQYNIAQ